MRGVTGLAREELSKWLEKLGSVDKKLPVPGSVTQVGLSLRSCWRKMHGTIRGLPLVTKILIKKTCIYEYS